MIFFYLNIKWRHPHLPEIKKSLTEIKEVAGISADNTIRRYCLVLQEEKEKIIERA